MVSRQKLNTPRFNGWSAVSLVGMLSLAVLAAIVGFLVYSKIISMYQPEDDARWVIFQLGLEHQRLQMSAEREESPEEIRLRGDIYLSRVFLVRDAPMLADLREGMVKENLSELFKSAQVTDALLANSGTPAGRDALLWQLRADAPRVRKLMLDMASLNRKLQAERRMEQSRSLLTYLAALELLLLALLGAGAAVFLISRKLRLSERELAGQLATQDAILMSVDAGILGLAPDGRVLYSNPRARALLGARADGGAVLPGDSEEGSLLAEISALLRQPAEPGADGSSGMCKVHVATAEGLRHYVIRQFQTQPETAETSGETADASRILTLTDVTVEEEAALRRDEYDARLSEASRLLAYAAISGGIVHEISQPLAAIRNYIFALKVSFNLKNASEEHRAIADHLGVEIDRAIEVVRNVRRMGPQDPQDAGACNIHEAIAHSVRLVTLGGNPPPPIAIIESEADARVAGSLPLIGQVIVNLLKNALSASSAAGHAGAEVRVTCCNQWAEIAVSDYGAGVSDDAAKSLFAPFSKSARGGMGLGLAICQRIASTLGGSLTWENREGAGAIFKFTVPLAKEGNLA